MRFIRREQITTTLFNKDITDEESIKSVFINLHSKNIDFSMTIQKLNIYGNNYTNLNFDNVRITKINEDNSFDMIFFKNNIKTSMKNIFFSDVVEINSIVKKNKILESNSSGTRWEIMDL